MECVLLAGILWIQGIDAYRGRFTMINLDKVVRVSEVDESLKIETQETYNNITYFPVADFSDVLEGCPK